MNISKKKIIGIFFVAIFSVGGFFFIRSRINAQNGADISYSPVSEYLTMEPGDKQNGEITVGNPGNTYMEYKVLVRPFESRDGSPGVPFPVSEEKAASIRNNASSWFEIKDPTLSIQPQGTADFSYTINVPQTTPSGGYYAGVFFQDTSTETDEQEPGKVGATLVGGPVFLLRIEGEEEIKESVNILDFKTKRKLYELPPVDFMTYVKNDGDVHVVPRGEIEITNMFGQKVETIKFNEGKYNVLPGYENIFENTWATGSNILEKVISKDKKVLIGKMKAKLVLLYRSENPGYDYKTVEVSFWVLPWKFLLVVILVVLGLVLLWVYRRSKKNNKTNKTNKTNKGMNNAGVPSGQVGTQNPAQPGNVSQQPNVSGGQAPAANNQPNANQLNQNNTLGGAAAVEPPEK